MNEYHTFLESVRPATISLVNSTTDFNPEAYWSEETPRAQRGVIARYQLTTTAKDFFDVTASYEFAIGKWSGDAPSDAPQPADAVVRVTGRFEAHFHVIVPFSRDDAERFTQHNAWLILWPYFREFVSSVTARMAIPPELLPLGLGAGEFAVPKKVKALPEPKAAGKMRIRKKKAAKPRKA